MPSRAPQRRSRPSVVSSLPAGAGRACRLSGAGLLVAALLALGGACAAPRAGRPSGTIDAYAAALAAGDYGRAYSLMSGAYRKAHSRDEYVRMLRDSPAEVKETSTRLRVGRRKVEITARLRYGDLGDSLVLVQENGEWRIGSDPLDFYPQDTPSSALRSFLRAVRNRRYEIALKFVPNEYRRFMSADHVKQQFEGEGAESNHEILRLLGVNLENQVEVQGDAARMPFGDRYEVKFRREDGVWKIEDLY